MNNQNVPQYPTETHCRLELVLKSQKLLLAAPAHYPAERRHYERAIRQEIYDAFEKLVEQRESEADEFLTLSSISFKEEPHYTYTLGGDPQADPRVRALTGQAMVYCNKGLTHLR